ncbi:MAG: hypothetical protein MUF62_13380 [Chitinophagaceae bacterium]|nr:hypothetical protein [Chitinophagaceae bacterium]
MSKTLVQKSRFTTTTFKIEDTGLFMSTKSKQKSTELHYAFEQIKTNRATVLDHNKGALILAFVFAGIALLVFFMALTDKTVEREAVPIWATISIGLFVFYFLTKKRKVYLQTTENKAIEFLANNDNLDTINDFIENVLTERNLYLVSKYATLNRNLEYVTQFDNLNWLLNHRAISKEKYDEKVQELNSLFDSHLTKKPIGFTANS